MKKKTVTTEVEVLAFDELSASYKQLVEAAKSATETAYAPYSRFHVGAAVLLANGTIVTGNNQENSAYPSGLCAERVAMFYANGHYPNVAPVAIAIAANTEGSFLAEPITPCGSCRQVLLESESRYQQSIEILLYGTSYTYKIDSIKDLLPLAFDKESLG